MKTIHRAKSMAVAGILTFSLVGAMATEALAALPVISTSDYDTKKAVTVFGGIERQTINRVRYDVRKYRSAGSPSIEVALFSLTNGTAAFKDEYLVTGNTRRKVLTTNYNTSNRSVALPVNHQLFENPASALPTHTLSYAYAGNNISSSVLKAGATEVFNVTLNVTPSMARFHLANAANAAGALQHVTANTNLALKNFIVTNVIEVSATQKRFAFQSGNLTILIEATRSEGRDIYRPVYFGKGNIDYIGPILNKVRDFAGDQTASPRNILSWSFVNGVLSVQVELAHRGLVKADLNTNNAAAPITTTFLRNPVDASAELAYVANRTGVSADSVTINSYQALSASKNRFILKSADLLVVVESDTVGGKKIIKPIHFQSVNGTGYTDIALDKIRQKIAETNPQSTATVSASNISAWSLSNGILTIETDLGLGGGLLRSQINTATLAAEAKYARNIFSDDPGFIDFLNTRSGPGGYTEFVNAAKSSVESLTGVDASLTRLTPTNFATDGVLIAFESLGYEWRYASQNAVEEGGSTANIIGIVKTSDRGGVDYVDQAVKMVYPDSDPTAIDFIRLVLSSKIKTTGFDQQNGFGFELKNAAGQSVGARVGIMGEASIINDTLNQTIQKTKEQLGQLILRASSTFDVSKIKVEESLVAGGVNKVLLSVDFGSTAMPLVVKYEMSAPVAQPLSVVPTKVIGPKGIDEIKVARLVKSRLSGKSVDSFVAVDLGYKNVGEGLPVTYTSISLKNVQTNEMSVINVAVITNNAVQYFEGSSSAPELAVDADIINQSRVTTTPQTNNNNTSAQLSASVMAELSSRNGVTSQTTNADPRMTPVMATNQTQDRRTSNQ